MKIIELTDYSFNSKKMARPFKPFDLSLTLGDVVSISTDSGHDALLFLKALATLTPPLQGIYRYKQNILDFSSYKKLLDVKKNIGFITSHAALISNRTVRENLLLMRAYFTNSLSYQLDEHTQELCRLFSFENKLELRPAALADQDYRSVVTVRELIKKPQIILLEYPEKFVGISNLGVFNEILFDMLGGEVCIVFLSEYQHFIETFSKRELVISKGSLQEIAQGSEGSRVADSILL
jgi:ABC-type lipoprotein export system ATPase subunit